MGRITKTLIAGTAAVGLLYVGGRYDLDDKIRAVYEAGKQEVKEILQEYKSRFSDANNTEQHYPLTLAEIAYQKRVEISHASAYVVAQTPPVQTQIIEDIYRGLSQATLIQVVVAGYDRLSYNNKILAYEKLTNRLEIESLLSDNMDLSGSHCDPTFNIKACR